MVYLYIICSAFLVSGVPAMAAQSKGGDCFPLTQKLFNQQIFFQSFDISFLHPIQKLDSLNTFVVPPCLHTHLPDDSQPAFSMALTRSSMKFQSSGIFLDITLKTSISRVGVLSSEISVSLYRASECCW